MTKEGKVKKILISGMMRSGTTLLQRVLNSHPKISLSYQSKTDCFLNIKNDFLKNYKISTYHTLWHYCQSDQYSFNDFQKWLVNNDIKINFFTDMEIDSTAVHCCGVKEVLVEEFYPYFISKGVFCLNILRDPRDVISSMSFGDGFEYTGKQRPVLFDLRNWRKSFHISHAMRKEYGFKNILFEDLILHSGIVIKEICSWLDIEAISISDIEAALAKDNWSGNSSFGEKNCFDKSAINNYKNVLPLSVIEYIEAVCFPEMKKLGYSLSINPKDRENIIRSYKDPFMVSRPEFDENYSSNLKNIEYEIFRSDVDSFDNIDGVNPW